MKFKIPRVWWISTVILEWPPRRREASVSTGVLCRELSLRPGELSSVSVASRLCWRPQWSAVSPIASLVQ